MHKEEELKKPKEKKKKGENLFNKNYPSFFLVSLVSIYEPQPFNFMIFCDVFHSLAITNGNAEFQLRAIFSQQSVTTNAQSQI